MIARLAALRASPPPVFQAASAWLDQRSQRERWLIGVMGVLIVAALLWYGLARPLAQARAEAMTRIDTQAMLQSRLRTATPGVAAAPPALEGPVAEVVAQRAAAAGLALTSASAQGDDVAVALANARFDAVVPFLQTLESSDELILRRVQIDRAGQPGLVNLQMQVGR